MKKEEGGGENLPRMFSAHILCIWACVWRMAKNIPPHFSVLHIRMCACLNTYPGSGLALPRV